MKHHLYLYNDDEHSFKYVWTALIEILDHLPLQAEQCCLIANNNNKAHVKEGDLLELIKYEQKLKDLDLKVEVCQSMYI